MKNTLCQKLCTASQKKILLAATGGTIASVSSCHGLLPGLDAAQLLDYIPKELHEKYCIDAIQICNIDSTNITPAHWVQIVETIREHYSSYDGFVICHGTDTMAYTAAALSYMIQNSKKPIVITGSQKPILQNPSDAQTNLSDAVLYAADDASQDVSLVFNGSVIAGTRAKKTFAHSFHAFSSVNFPLLARIRDGYILRYISAPPFSGPVRFTTAINSNIAVLKLIPGTGPELLEFLFDNYDGLIIESFGVGGIPDRLLQVFSEAMHYWMSHGKIAVMATQVVNEGSNMSVYAVGEKVKTDFDLLETYDMTFEAAAAKLMFLLGKYKNDYENIRNSFYIPVNYDITFVPK